MTPQPPRQRFVKGQGWTTVEIQEGPTKDGALGLAAQYQAAGYTNIDVYSPNDGATWRVEASIEGQGEGSPPEPSDTWELDALSEGGDLRLHPYFANIPNVLFRRVRDAIKHDEDIDLTGMSESDLVDAPKAIELFMMMLRGVTSYVLDAPVLRHRQTPAPALSVNGVERVWTVPQLHAVGAIPPVIATSINLLAGNNPYGTILVAGATDIKHTWGWKRLFPQIVEDVYGRSTMTEEWVLANWPVNIYPAF